WLPTVSVPCHAPDEETGKLAAVTFVLPRVSVTRTNGAPVTPAGSRHGVTEDTVTGVPGGPASGVARKTADWASAALAHPPISTKATTTAVATVTANLRVPHPFPSRQPIRYRVFN